MAPALIGAPASVPPTPDAARIESDDTALTDTAARRLTVADALAHEDRPGSDSAGSDRLLGTLVHRLLQRFGMRPELEAETLRRAARQLLRPEEAAGVPAGSDAALAWIDRALAGYASVTANPEVRALVAEARLLSEVPFTMRHEGQVVRGTIDCLVLAAGRATVLEFKTGRPRADHDAQLALYRQAVEQLFPGLAIDARLVYCGVLSAGDSRLS